MLLTAEQEGVAQGQGLYYDNFTNRNDASVSYYFVLVIFHCPGGTLTLISLFKIINFVAVVVCRRLRRCYNANPYNDSSSLGRADW